MSNQSSFSNGHESFDKTGRKWGDDDWCEDDRCPANTYNGPGEFQVKDLGLRFIDGIRLGYWFKSGMKAELFEKGRESFVHPLEAPKGVVQWPVDASSVLILRLPAETSMICAVVAWHWDPAQWEELERACESVSPQIMEGVRKDKERRDELNRIRMEERSKDPLFRFTDEE